MIPRDVIGTAHPLASSREYKPDQTATAYAVCPSCRTLYLGVGADAVLCCNRHVNCAVHNPGVDEHCIDIRNECPIEFAYRVVDWRGRKP